MQYVPPPLCILIVDDDAIVRTLLREHLISSGHDVIAVASAAEAMRAIETNPVRIIIADWLMPELSGLELLRWVRKLTVRPQPHFVMLTANTGRDSLVEAFNAGVDDFLSKPLNDSELLARLKAWTRLTVRQTEASQRTEELLVSNKQLSEIALSDELTSLANRRSAMKHLNSCIERASTLGGGLSCAMIDLDHFKQYNDLHGHATGDEVLKYFANMLRLSTRSTDQCCRLSGDEFLVILPHTPLEAASSWAHQLAAALAKSPLHHKELTLTVRVSMGLADWRPSMNADELLEAADRMLYDAKKAGRGAVRVCA